MRPGFKIIVQSNKFIFEFLKHKLDNKHKVYYHKKQNKDFFSNCKDADVLITMSWGKTIFGGTNKTSLIPLTKLKLLHLPGAGLDGIDFSQISKATKVCNVYGHEIPIAEYCVGTILSWEMQLIKKINGFKKLDWKDSLVFAAPFHGELFNKKIAILGYGRIGKEISKKLSVFDTKVIAFTRKKIKKDNFLSALFLTSEIKKHIHLFDYIIIACSLNNSTKNLIEKNLLSLMKKTAVIVNIARGEIIKEKDLYDSLKNKQLGGAIIDTWYKYPVKLIKNFKPSNYDFHKLNNVIMTPHISAWSSNMISRRSELIKKNIDNLFNKKKLYNQIKF